MLPSSPGEMERGTGGGEQVGGGVPSEGYDFTGIYGPSQRGRELRSPSPSQSRRRRIDISTPPNRADPGSASADATAPPTDVRVMFEALMTQLRVQENRSQQQADDLHRRLTQLEGQVSSGSAVPVPPGLGSTVVIPTPAQMVIPPPPPPVSTGFGDGGRNFDMKWVPNMPLPNVSQWKTRLDEIHNFWSWVEQLSSWLSLLHPCFQGEIKEVLHRRNTLYDVELSPEQMGRSQRLLHLLKQSFQGFRRVEHLIQVFEATGTGASSGYELLRQLRQEFSLHSRTEALHFRREFLEMKVVKTDDVHDILRQIDVALLKFQRLVSTYAYPQMIEDLKVPESDLYLLILRNLPHELRSYVKLHSGETVSDLRRAVEFFHSRSRLLGPDGEKLKALKEKERALALKGDGKGKGKEKGKGSKGKNKGKDGKGKEKGKNDKSSEKGKNGHSRPNSQDSGKGEMVCYRCGKPGHRSRECPDREKDKDKKCTRCGKRGHLKEKCRVKLRVLTDESDSNGSGSEPASEPEESRVFMVFRHHVHERVPGQTTSHLTSSSERVDRAVGDVISSEAVSHDVLKSSSRVSSERSAQWLVDTGATSHIVSKRFVNNFKVVKAHQAHVELRAANQQIIETEGLVDLEVRFLSVVDGSSKIRSFVLTRCIVADTSMNVLSPYVLSGHGWNCVFDVNDSYLCQKASGLQVPLVLRERAWFVDSPLKTSRSSSPKSSRSSKPQPMDVSLASDSPKVVPKGVLKHSAVSKELKTEPVFASELESSSLPSMGELATFQAGNLTFLYRGLDSDVVSLIDGVNSSSRASSSEVFKALGSNDPVGDFIGTFPVEHVLVGDDDVMDDGDMPDHPLPHPDDPLDGDDELDNEPRELDPGPNHLYEHFARGHIPYSKTCLSCCRAAGRSPARRMKGISTAHLQVGSDYGFFGRALKFLVVIVFSTGMLGVVPMSMDAETNMRCLNRVLRDVGVTGRSVELVSDGESAVQSFFRSAAKLDTFPCSDLHFRTVGRSQSNGIAERAVGVIKQLVSAHILFLESRISKRIPLESPLLAHLLKFVSHVHNIHSVPQGSSATALDKMRGQIDTQRPKTFPFGVTCLGRPLRDSKVHALERFSQIVYLGPTGSTGGKVLGVLAGESRIGLKEVEWQLVRTFQVVKLLTPCVWDSSDLSWMISPGPDLPLPYDPIDEVDPDKTLEGVPAGSKPAPERVFVPPGGPPRRWLDTHGLTPGCYGCRGISERNSAVHSKACKKRYENFLREQIRLREQTQEESEKEPSEEPLRKRIRGKTTDPPGYPSVPVSGDPGVPASGSDDGSVPSPAPAVPPDFVSDDVDMDEIPVGDESGPMDVELLVHQFLVTQETAFLRGFPTKSSGKMVWFQSSCFGSPIYQGFSTDEVCEISGKLFDPEELKLALTTEHEQLTTLKVGDFLNETEARSVAAKAGSRVISTRWVLVQKVDRVRARLVCRDYRSAGLSSLRENIYAPTSSLDCLRLMICLAETSGSALLTADVSTAFLFAPLFTTEVVVFPPNMTALDGSRLYVRLHKALYGLRKAPLAWFRELKTTLLDLGMEETSEPTLFRVSIRRSLVLLLIYVDDLIVVGPLSACEALYGKLAGRYQIKETGRLLPGKVGSLQFLGRVICRAEVGGGLKLCLNPTYFDGIEAALGESLKSLSSPPNLTRFEKDDQALSEEKAKRFRQVLGRLAWFSLTMPLLSFHISWLGSFQSSPTVGGERGLIETLRFAKGFRCWAQSFNHEGPWQWAPGLEEIRVVVDASWGLKSSMGGVILFNGCRIKSWSRRIQTTCLSSPEAEMHALAEGAKEGLAFGIIAESLLKGLPPKNALGIFERMEATLPIVMWSDSEGAIHMGQMHGLLRRVRHLELRAQLVQELVMNNRLTLRFVAGDKNGADFLTKCSDTTHLQELLYLTGLEETSFEHDLSLTVSSSLKHLHLSNQNSRRVQEGVEITVRRILSDLHKFSTENRQEVALKVSKRVTFGDTTTLEYPCDTLCAFRSIPKQWDRVLNRFPVLEPLRRSLSKFCQGHMLVVEVCCDRDSSLRRICKLRSIPYIGIDDVLDVTSSAVKFLLQCLKTRPNWLALHLSTPCTAGCGFRHLAKHNASACQTWQRKFGEHRKVWKSLRDCLEGYSSRSRIMISQEWPKGCDLWSDRVYQRIAVELGLLYFARVDRHGIDGIFKKWIFRCNRADLAELLRVEDDATKDQCVQVSLKETGSYSMAVASHLLYAFEKIQYDDGA